LGKKGGGHAYGRRSSLRVFNKRGGGEEIQGSVLHSIWRKIIREKEEG